MGMTVVSRETIFPHLFLKLTADVSHPAHHHFQRGPLRPTEKMQLVGDKQSNVLRSHDDIHERGNRNHVEG